MKQVFGGKVYNTATAIKLAEVPAHSNGNYVGSNTLMQTPKGALFGYASSNGLDCYRGAGIEPLSVAEAREYIDGWVLDEDEITALEKAGIIEPA